ncbi:DoxX family protein [Corynebacterium sp. sy017]|uniref:DoxX family protein n=1 Tax=unclassified Corynebacterium TaxID=2624378 RepID=UPI001184F3B9|nr:MULTISPECIES: DoxX family protein [unclassified Corynebacterium]MBP3088500.1 DoxX family protein [Corynebacterium sp. sy017]QDZ41921.1 DoxX family protein [Corynebacterium sp. sy039]TSD91805.1 DoxX family protein [Corynebacterium sp. SY003]
MSIIKDIALLISRVILGVILVAHGWDKFQNLDGVTAMFTQVGAPMPNLSALAAASIELGGGILLILGLLTPIAGVLVFLVMLGAAILVHLENGIMAADGGWELVGAIGVAALALAAAGSGTFGIDQIFRRSKSKDPKVAHTAEQ